MDGERAVYQAWFFREDVMFSLLEVLKEIFMSLPEQPAAAEDSPG